MVTMSVFKMAGNGSRLCEAVDFEKQITFNKIIIKLFGN